MVGGTKIHRQIHERALVEMKEREELLLGEENTSPAARTLFVSLDRADAIIEGGPHVSPEDEFGCPTCRGYTRVFSFLLRIAPSSICRWCGFGISYHPIHSIELKFTLITKVANLWYRCVCYSDQTSPIPPAIVSSPPAHFGLLRSSASQSCPPLMVPKNTVTAAG